MQPAVMVSHADSLRLEELYRQAVSSVVSESETLHQRLSLATAAGDTEEQLRARLRVVEAEATAAINEMETIQREADTLEVTLATKRSAHARAAAAATAAAQMRQFDRSRTKRQIADLEDEIAQVKQQILSGRQAFARAREARTRAETLLTETEATGGAESAADEILTERTNIEGKRAITRAATDRARVAAATAVAAADAAELEAAEAEGRLKGVNAALNAEKQRFNLLLRDRSSVPAPSSVLRGRLAALMQEIHAERAALARIEPELEHATASLSAEEHAAAEAAAGAEALGAETEDIAATLAANADAAEEAMVAHDMAQKRLQAVREQLQQRQRILDELSSRKGDAERRAGRLQRQIDSLLLETDAEINNDYSNI